MQDLKRGPSAGHKRRGGKESPQTKKSKTFVNRERVGGKGVIQKQAEENRKRDKVTGKTRNIVSELCQREERG